MRACVECGTRIDHKRSNAKYCTRQCKNRAGDRRRSAGSRRVPPDGAPQGTPRGRVLRACDWCGELVEVDQQAKFCGSSCRYKSRYARNREKAKARQIAAYWSNRERELERSRRYRKENPDRRRGFDDVRHARMAGNRDYLPFTHAEWQRLVNQYRGQCAYCHRRPSALEMDHVIPLSRGGRHAIANILPVCASCNRRKSSQLLIEWRYRNGRR